MAGRGPAPKEPEKRRRGARDGNAQTVLSADGELRGPELPALRSSGGVWPDVTRRWWDTYRRSPQAQVWTETDWQSHLVTADLHAAYWSDEGGTKFAPELRLREARMGATYEDRLRLRLRVVEPDAGPRLAPVADLPDYRSRLSGDAS